jgi:hypothetical protein
MIAVLTSGNRVTLLQQVKYSMACDRRDQINSEIGSGQRHVEMVVNA